MNMRFLPGLLILTLFSCSSTKNLINEDFQVKMNKGACFGSCPVYTLDIDNQGNAVYVGERFTEKMGKHSMKLKKSDLQDIAKKLAEVNFFALNEEYKSDVADQPLIAISHTNKGLSKTVKGKDRRPEALLELQSMLEKVAETAGWKSLEPAADLAKTDESEEEIEEEDKQIVEREIIIQFKAGTIISRWMREFREYQMYVQKPLTQDNKTWIVQYNTKLINPQMMLHKVQAHDGVESAEFNTKPSLR